MSSGAFTRSSTCDGDAARDRFRSSRLSRRLNSGSYVLWARWTTPRGPRLLTAPRLVHDRVDLVGRVRRVSLLAHLEQRAFEFGRSAGAFDDQTEVVRRHLEVGLRLVLGGMVRPAALECGGGVERAGGLVGN